MLSAFIRAKRRYPAYAPGGTAGTQEVCPSRSSRTRDELPHHSTPTTDRRPTIMLPSRFRRDWLGHFCLALHVAMQFGLYLPRMRGVRRIVSEGFTNTVVFFCDIFRNRS